LGEEWESHASSSTDPQHRLPWFLQQLLLGSAPSVKQKILKIGITDPSANEQTLLLTPKDLL